MSLPGASPHPSPLRGEGAPPGHDHAVRPAPRDPGRRSGHSPKQEEVRQEVAGHTQAYGREGHSWRLANKGRTDFPTLSIGLYTILTLRERVYSVRYF